MTNNLERFATTCHRQWLYLLGEEGVVYSEAQNRFAGLDAAGVAAYRAFDAGASLSDLRGFTDAGSFDLTSNDGLETIYPLSRGVFPHEDIPAEWPAFDPSKYAGPCTANIEIHGIPILLEYLPGTAEDLCLDYFWNCARTTRPARCHLSVQPIENGWAIYVNGREFFPLRRKEQLGLGLMHATRSLLYAEGEYDVAFHAAMVAHGSSGVLLCAPREHGKSTLAGYLVSQGFDLLTDEPALLELDTSSVASLRLPVSLKQGSWPFLQQEWPQLGLAPIHVRSDGTKICLLHPPLYRYPDQPQRLTSIVFSQYTPSLAAQIEPLSPLRTLSLLTDGGMLLARHITRDKFEMFLGLLCVTPSYRMRYTSLEEARTMLHGLCCRPRPPIE